MRWAEKSENLPSLLTKTENQRLNWSKPANHTRHQNRKTAVFKCENQTKNWPNLQNQTS